MLSTLKYISFYNSISISYVTFSLSFGCPITLQENLGQGIFNIVKNKVLLYQSILLASLVCLAPHAYQPSVEFL